MKVADMEKKNYGGQVQTLAGMEHNGSMQGINEGIADRKYKPIMEIKDFRIEKILKYNKRRDQYNKSGTSRMGFLFGRRHDQNKMCGIW